MTQETKSQQRGTGARRKLGAVAIGAAVIVAFVLLKPPSDRIDPNTTLVLCGGSMRAAVSVHSRTRRWSPRR